MSLYAGTSGFSYASWRGTFYPPGLPAARMLEHYAGRLNGVELNGTFYRTPAEGALSGWVARTPPEFRFCPKAHRALTYSAAGFDKAAVARDLTHRLEPLAPRLGPLLLQFPPVRQLDLALLESLLSALARPVAAEFRHESWFTPAVAEVLRRHGGAMVVTDAEDWPRAEPGDFAFSYYRLRRDYTEEELAGWAGQIRRDLASGRDVHAYFRHTAEGPLRAERLRELAGPPA